MKGQIKVTIGLQKNTCDTVCRSNTAEREARGLQGILATTSSGSSGLSVTYWKVYTLILEIYIF